MAQLINCNICGEQMSDQARVCPHCGHPRKMSHAALVWAWALGILVLGILIYIVLPIPHVIGINFTYDNQPVTTTVPVVTTAPITTVSYGTIDAGTMISNPSNNYVGQNLEITGMILDVTYDDYVPYFRLIGTNGAEETMTVQVFFPTEYTSIYNLQYGDIVTAYVTCNERAEYAYQCDLIFME